MNDDEKFFAWLDGELSGPEAAEVEARVAADARLQRLAEQHRALAVRLRSAFDSVAEAPLPAELIEAARPAAPKPVGLAPWRERLRAPSAFGPVPQWAAMAATLVLGLVLGTMLAGDGASSPVELRDGKLYAAATLDEALERQLASADASEPVRIGITFRDQAGTICRTFADDRSSGLACRDQGDWQVRGLFAAPVGQDTDYRMASSVDPNLAALVDSTIAGDAFDAEQEKAARQQGWQ